MLGHGPPMVLDCLDAKLAHLFYVAEPVATASLVDPTGTPTGSGMLWSKWGAWSLDRLHRHLARIGAPDPMLGP